jgi:hypothetical protein
LPEYIPRKFRPLRMNITDELYLKLGIEAKKQVASLSYVARDAIRRYEGPDFGRLTELPKWPWRKK